MWTLQFGKPPLTSAPHQYLLERVFREEARKAIDCPGKGTLCGIGMVQRIGGWPSLHGFRGGAEQALAVAYPDTLP